MVQPMKFGNEQVISLYWACDYLSMLGIKSNPVSKTGALYVLNFTLETKMYLQFISFIDTDMKQVIEILPHVRQKNVVNIIDADVLAMQRAKASATILTVESE